MTNEAGTLNLKPTRGPNIWDDERWNAAGHSPEAARWLLGVGGSVLLAVGATRGSAVRRVVSAAGGAAALALASGRVSLDRPRALLARVWPKSEAADRVDDDSRLSFPASDAPAWTPTTGTGTPGR